MHCETCTRLNLAVEAALDRLKQSAALMEAGDPPSTELIDQVEKHRRAYTEALKQLEAHVKTHEEPGVIH